MAADVSKCTTLGGSELTAIPERYPSIRDCLMGNDSDETSTESQVARVDREYLLLFVLDCSRAFLFCEAGQLLTSSQYAVWRRVLAARAAGQPIAYVVGQKSFWTLDLRVTSDTLIPRADTEVLVEQALRFCAGLPSPCCLDVGTGSGAIALALAVSCPHAWVLGVDVSPSAIRVAQKNAQLNRVENIQWSAGCWLKAIRRVDQIFAGFDVIVSNPPYLAKNDPHLLEGDLRFEPAIALVAERAGLAALAEVINQARFSLRLGGGLFVEHGCDQGAAVRALFLKAGYLQVQTALDLNQKERVTSGLCAIGQCSTVYFDRAVPSKILLNN